MHSIEMLLFMQVKGAVVKAGYVLYDNNKMLEKGIHVSMRTQRSTDIREVVHQLLLI